MTEDVPPAKRAEWQKWATKEFGANGAAVDAATDAVLEALMAGCSVDDALSVGRTAGLTQAADAGPGDPKEVVENTKLAHPVSDADNLRGQVSSFRTRNELMGNRFGTVWNFRVDSWDRAGKPQPAVAVEMRGLGFIGSVGDGDWVEIAGPWKAGEVMRPPKLRNITMNAPVIPSGVDTPAAAVTARPSTPGVAKTILVIIILAVIAIAFLSLIPSMH